MSDLYVKLLEASLEFGQGSSQMVGALRDEVTTNYDISSDKSINILDYHIYKIKYCLNSSQRIQSLQLLYKNRNDGSIKMLLDTKVSHLRDEKESEIDFEDFEEIVDVFFYVGKDDRLAAICITTNKNKIKYIGNKDNGELMKEEKLMDGNKIVFGFGMHACIKFGVCSIYAYFMDKKRYGIIQYGGLLQLRAKIKTDKEYRKQLQDKRDTLDEKQKLILDTCDLPETGFFPIACYIMSI